MAGALIAQEFAPVVRLLRSVCDRRALLWFGATMLVVCAGGLAAGLAPLALKRLVDGVLSHPTSAGVIVWPVSAYGLALLLQRLAEQVQVYCHARGELPVLRRFNVAAFEHLLRLPLRAHHAAGLGTMTQALAEGGLGLRLILAHLVVSLLPVLVQLAVAGLVVGAELGQAAGLVLVGALAAYGGVFAAGVRRLDGPMRGVSAANVAAAGALSDSLLNVEALKAFVAETRYAQRYDERLAHAEGQWKLFHRRRLEHGAAVALVFSVTAALALAVMSRDALDGKVTIGAVVMLSAYLLQMVRPLEMLGFAARDIGQGLAYLAALSSLLAQPPERRAPASPRPPPRTPAALTFDQVSFSFGPDQPVLREVSFQLKAGASLALVGPSGAGKSSIVRLILGLYAPDRGVIRLDGQPIADLTLEDLRRQVALVAQDTILLNDSLAANITLGASGAHPADIAAAARAARLGELAEALPEGLGTQVGERGLRLSGGERQRVAVARVVLKRARLLLLDEATAALDPHTEETLWRGLAAATNGATRLIVTHRLAAARQADQILVLDKGLIVARGAHDDLLQAGGLYRRLWTDQARGGAPGGQG